MSTLDHFVNIPTPKLEVPEEFKPTLAGRGWMIWPFQSNPWWSAIVACLPALLGTILIFMDQQITAVIVNRKENKLKASVYSSFEKRSKSWQKGIDKVYRSCLERMRLSFGSVRPCDPDRNLLGDGTALVRRGNGALDQSREFVEAGIGMCRARWKTAVPRCPRTTCYTHFNFFDDRLLGSAHANAETHTDAGAVWSFPLHGSCFVEGTSIFRQNFNHADAG